VNTRPRLVPLTPHRGCESPLDASPFWLGSGNGCGLRLHLPGIAERHAAILEREDGFWLVPMRAVRPAPRINGVAVAAELRLRTGDVIELLPGVAFRFATEEQVAEPGVRRPPRRRSRAPWRSNRQRLARSVTVGIDHLGRAGWIASALALLLALAAGAMLVRAIPLQSAAHPLPDGDAEHLNALNLRAYEHVERGTTLLELGLADAALQEFARAVHTLREHPAARQNAAALERTVAAIYRSRRIPVPQRYATSRSPGARGTTIRGGIPPDEFADRFARVQQRFIARFGRPLVVTGRDHPEHLSLYGPASALDLRVRDLSREQVDFAVAALRAEGVRVKDFSDDAVLRAQIRSAHAAGLASRAGTGLHLHADRFPDRRDRWTVR
jgi:hypothetical protein